MYDPASEQDRRDARAEAWERMEAITLNVTRWLRDLPAMVLTQQFGGDNLMSEQFFPFTQDEFTFTVEDRLSETEAALEEALWHIARLRDLTWNVTQTSPMPGEIKSLEKRILKLRRAATDLRIHYADLRIDQERADNLKR